MKQVHKYDISKKLYSIHKEALKFTEELQLQTDDVEIQETIPIAKIVRELKGTAKMQAINNFKARWKGKPLHGQYVQKVEKEDIDKELTHKWLQCFGLKAETEGLLIAAQGQSLATRYYQHKIINNGASQKCRLCHEFDESIEHIISGCPLLGRKEYLERHDKALIYIHWHI